MCKLYYHEWGKEMIDHILLVIPPDGKKTLSVSVDAKQSLFID